MRVFLFVLTVLSLLASPARAERLDLATVRCGDFFASGKDNIERVMMWLEAYFSEENASPIIDFDKLQSDRSKLGEYCAKNPKSSLIDAAEKLLSR
ncbi:MAG TPA: HdeA/HdeB family chaperone [Pseudolabrys sp.]|nr:HdeA/HdeB family chaperone [Pseudolabrys sp.]